MSGATTEGPLRITIDARNDRYDPDDDRWLDQATALYLDLRTRPTCSLVPRRYPAPRERSTNSSWPSAAPAPLRQRSNPSAPGSRATGAAGSTSAGTTTVWSTSSASPARRSTSTLCGASPLPPPTGWGDQDGRTYRALLIGNSTYPADEHNLQPLKGPVKDIAALNRALVDRSAGLFADVDVTLLPEATSARVIRALGRFFDSADRDDVLLLYFSGHGKLDQPDVCTSACRTPSRGSCFRRR